MAHQHRSAMRRAVKDLIRTVVYLPAMTPVTGEWLICCFPRYISAESLYRFLRKEITSHKHKSAGCLQLLASWVRLRGRGDFSRGSRRLDSVLALLQTLSTDPETATLLPRLNEVKLALLAVLPKHSRHSASLPSRTVAAGTSTAALFSFPTAQIAAQLTRVDHAAFAAVPLDDFLEKRWESPVGKPCKLRELIERSNNLSDWVASCVLVQPNPPGQVRAVERFLEVAHHCLEHGDYLAVSGIMAGFAQWSISRLTRLWQIHATHKVLHQHISSIMSSDKNYATYRATLAEHIQLRKPCVPHVALFLRDLTFIEDGNVDYGVDDAPNQKKIHMIGALIEQIHRLQHTQYDDITAKADVTLQQRLETLPRKKLEWLEKRSKELRPMATDSATESSNSGEMSTRSELDMSDESVVPLEDINEHELSSSSSSNNSGGPMQLHASSSNNSLGKHLTASSSSNSLGQQQVTASSARLAASGSNNSPGHQTLAASSARLTGSPLRTKT